MRKAFRKSSAAVLALAITAAVGGLIPSGAAVTYYPMRAHALGALPQDMDETTESIKVAVSQISNVKPDGPDAGTAPDPLPSTSLRLTYLLLPNGAPTQITSAVLTPPPSTYDFSIPGPLLPGDYSILVEQFDDAVPTPNVISKAVWAFSVRVPDTITLSVESDTVMPMGLPAPLAGFGGRQVVSAVLKDATGATIWGHLVTLYTSGGIMGASLAPCGKYTDGEGKMSCTLEGGQVLTPGSYTTDAEALKSYTLDLLGNKVNKQFAKASITWSVVAAA